LCPGRDNKKPFSSFEGVIERLRPVEIALPDTNTSLRETSSCIGVANADANIGRLRKPQELLRDLIPKAASRACDDNS
jgi:hypothetical protein